MSQATPVPAAARDRPRIVLGAMSGTSADGVDVAAAEVTGRGLGMAAKYLGHVEHPYDADLRRRIFALRESGACRLDELAGLGRDITLAYAEATRALMEQLSLRPSQVAGLAAHGQTLYHAPPESIQWLDPSLLASRTGLPTISDFRRADLAAGGQGAPLVPFADWILFRHPEKTRVILNIGGIANLTYLPAGGGIEEVIAFDTGPGMCISDWIIRTHTGGEHFHDEGGRLARVGVPSDRICWLFADDPFVDASPPKSTDGPAMIRAYQEIVAGDAPEEVERRLEDRLATACAITARCISDALAHSAADVASIPDEILLGGGGARNAAIVQQIEREFSLAAWSEGSEPHALLSARGGHVPVRPLRETGWDGAAREAVAFAILGAATLDGQPSNVPRATGAARRVVLGSITPRPGT